MHLKEIIFKIFKTSDPEEWKPSFAAIFRHIILAYIISISVHYLMVDKYYRVLTGTDFLLFLSFSGIILLTLLLAPLFFILSRFVIFEKIEPILIAVGIFIYALLSLASSFTPYFFAIFALVAIAAVCYCFYGYDSSEKMLIEPQKHKKLYICITVALALLFCAFVAIWTVFRVLTCSTPTYDFGIFAQMFYNMKQSFLPITTLERHVTLSHFKVHMSPIYYLMLPFYCIFPHPATLQALCAVVLASSVIPLWLIASHYGLSPKRRMLICAMFMMYPAFCAGVGYDLHENIFLTPCLLWLFWAVEKRSIIFSLIFAALTLGIKEDAAVYVAVIGIYLLINYLLHDNKKEKVKQIIISGLLIVFSISYFLVVTNYLAKFGDGVMTWRYDNFIYDDSASLITVIKAVIMSPAKMLFECVDVEKLGYIALTMIPLLGLPLLTRKYERYILLIPYLLINLMTDYLYQYDIFFQYSFGSSAFLIYLAVINLSDIKKSRKKSVVQCGALCLSALCFFAIVFPNAMQYPTAYYNNQEKYECIAKTLSKIPEDASVATSAFFTTYLSEREVLYDVYYSTNEMILSCDYVVLADVGYEKEIAMIEGNGYTLQAEYEGAFVVYKAPAD